MYTIVLGDGWLQTYNPAIDWKNCTIKFNLALCIESRCLARGILYIEFVISSKLKDKIGLEKLTAINDVDIKLVSTKHFF